MVYLISPDLPAACQRHKQQPQVCCHGSRRKGFPREQDQICSIYEAEVPSKVKATEVHVDTALPARTCMK